MPHLIVSTVALLSNLYKNAPLIVGDKDSDPDLMRFLGARITTNYPACGSPPMYVMHAPPRTVFDNLEKRGYCLMSAQTIQEHSVWILARPRVPDDDKVEISRGGPNDKSIQAFDDPEGSRAPSPSVSRQRSLTKTPRIVLTKSSSKQSLKEENTMNITIQNYPLLNQGSSVSQKSLQMETKVLNFNISRNVSTDLSLIPFQKLEKPFVHKKSSNEKSDSRVDEDSSLRKPSQMENQPVITSQLFNSELSQNSYSVVDEKSSLRKPLQMEKQSCERDTRSASPDGNSIEKNPNSMMLSVQFRESSPGRKSSHKTKKLLENQKLSVEIVENEPKRRTSHRPRKILESEDPRSRSVSPDKKGSRDISPNSHSLTLQVPENFSKRRSTQKDKKSFFPNNLKLSVQVTGNSPIRNSLWAKEKQFEIEDRSRSISPEKEHKSPSDSNKVRDPLPQAQKIRLKHKEVQKPSCTRICVDNDPSHSQPASPKKGYNTGQEDSPKILPSNKKDPWNVKSKGDAGTLWLGSEKVHMGIQASNSEMSLKKGSDIMSRVTFNPRKHSELLKRSDESLGNPTHCETPKGKSGLKCSVSFSKQIQADFDSDPPIVPHKSGISVHFDNPKDAQSRIIDLNDLPRGGTDQYPTETVQGSHYINPEVSGILKGTSVFKDSVILKSLASRCSHIALDDADAPVLIDITDPNQLTCLTHDNCCCEDS